MSRTKTNADFFVVSNIKHAPSIATRFASSLFAHRRAAIFGKTNVKGGKNYQPLSRSDFDSMVQGVFDDSDEDSLDGDLEMGNTDFNNRSGVTAVKTKLDFDGDFGDSDEEDYKV